MARSGLVEIADASFEKDGKQIDYRKARITAEGRTADASTPLLVAIEIESDPRGRNRKAGKKKAATRKETVVAPGKQSAIEAALRAWRLAEAKSKAIPAFRILTDRALQAIAVKQPRTPAELIEISGVGQSLVQKYATQIFRIIEKVG
jgi:DNA topoisomerase III